MTSFFCALAIGLTYALETTLQRIPPEVFDFEPPSSVVPEQGIVRLAADNESTLVLPGIKGAESFSEDPETGSVYTGTAEGRLLRLQLSDTPSNKLMVSVAEVTRLNVTDVGSGEKCGHAKYEAQCGRLLGLRVARPTRGESPSLFACESNRGLIRIDNINSDDGSSAKIINLSSSGPGGNESSSEKPVRFCNSLEVTKTAIYFTDSSNRPRSQFLLSILEGHATGRLLKYDIANKTTTLIRSGLYFPNGLTLTHDGRDLLMVELLRATIWKIPLEENRAWVRWAVLPFLPDNIQRHPDGSSYLVGGYVKRSPVTEKLLSKQRLLRAVLVALPMPFTEWLLKIALPKPSGTVALLSHEGKLQAIIQGGQAPLGQVSEGFETNVSRAMLWGSFAEDQPLVITPGVRALLLQYGQSLKLQEASK